MNPTIKGANRILLHKGRGLFSRLIQLQTRSPYSHASFLTRFGTIIESREGKGVHTMEFDGDLSGVDVFEIPSFTDEDWKIVHGHALDRVGSKYDWRSVFRFVTRKSAKKNNRYFCSELVYESVQAAGLNLLARIAPALLALSPLMRKVA